MWRAQGSEAALGAKMHIPFSTLCLRLVKDLTKCHQNQQQDPAALAHLCPISFSLVGLCALMMCSLSSADTFSSSWP